MSEFRDFVADLLERRGAAVEALGSDRLEVLAPAPLQRLLGWPELTHLGFGTQQAPDTVAIALESDWLDRFGALLADEGRWSEREVRLPAPVPPPSDPERLLDRVLDLPNAIWRHQGHVGNLDTLPDAGVPPNGGVGREARETDLARLQPRHWRGDQRHPGAAAAGVGANGRLAYARHGDQAPCWTGMERSDARGAAASAARAGGTGQHGAVLAHDAPVPRFKASHPPSLAKERQGTRAYAAGYSACLSRYFDFKYGLVWSSPARARTAKPAPTTNVHIEPAASHRAPAMMLAASMARPPSRLNMP
jgi:hypothetical protein